MCVGPDGPSVCVCVCSYLFVEQAYSLQVASQSDLHVLDPTQVGGHKALPLPARTQTHSCTGDDNRIKSIVTHCLMMTKKMIVMLMMMIKYL